MHVYKGVNDALSKITMSSIAKLLFVRFGNLSALTVGNQAGVQLKWNTGE